MKSPKTKKTIIAVVAIVLVIAIAAAAAVLIIQKKKSSDEYDSYNYDTTPIVYDENYISPDDAENLFEIDYSEPEPIAHNKRFDAPVKADMEDFIDDLKDEEVDLYFAELFSTKKYLKNQRPLDKVEQHKFDITEGTGVVDEKTLYDAVQKNNKEYIDYYKAHEDAPDGELLLFEKASKKIVKKACGYIAEYINKAAQSEYWQDVDFDRVYCNLSTLKILHRKNADFSLAFVDENNVLSINPEVLENNASMLVPDITEMTEKEIEKYAWDSTLVHEIVHLLQDSCPCIEKKDELMIGNMRFSDDDELHTLFDFWLVEAAAELGKNELTNQQANTYFSFINYYYSMVSSFYLDPGVSAKKIMRTTFDKEAYPFYKAFGKLDNEELEELIGALFSVEALTNDNQGFINKYNDEYGVLLLDAENEDKKELVNQKLRLNALKVFAKHFYISLAKQVEEGKMSYNDMFYLIRIYEHALYEHLNYNEEDRAMTSNEFFDYYLEIQDSFFKELANDSITGKELADGLVNYSPKCKDGKKVSDNFSLSWMNTEQKQALERINENYYYINIPSIREAKEIYVKNGYDKSVKY